MSEISNLLYQLKITEQKMTHLFEKRLEISLTRYQILQTLLKQSPCSQIDLQESLQIDQAAITRHLRQLEETGYISRQRNPHNQRQIRLKKNWSFHHPLTIDRSRRRWKLSSVKTRPLTCKSYWRN